MANQTPEHELLTELQAARILQLRPNTLRKWRFEGKPPSFVKIGGTSIRYRRSDIDRFIAADVVDRQTDCGS